MRFATVCSGVSAEALAWIPLGWKPVFFAEVEPFPSAVLMRRFGATRPLVMPDPKRAESSVERERRRNWIKQVKKLPKGGTVPNLGDMTKIKGRDYRGAIDILAGGTPCQDFSVAGKRAGLDGERSGLARQFVRLLGEIRPAWFVWENVPGVFSSNEGRDFASIIDAFEDVGYSCAWRTLDAQFVRVEPGFPGAVPQRRRRVFVVGHLGDWRPAAAVLFESGCMSWDSPPRREAGKRAADGFEVGPSGGRRSDVSATLDAGCKDGAVRSQVGMLCMAHGQAHGEINVDMSPTLNCDHEAPIISFLPQHKAESMCPMEDVSNTIVNGTNPGFQNAICFHGSQDPISNCETANALGRNHGLENCVCYENHGQDSRITETGNVAPQINAKAGTGGGNLPLLAVSVHQNQAGEVRTGDVAVTINTNSNASGRNAPLTMHNSVLRRLTPLECERLMGFPDNHTRISWKGKPEDQCPDGPRYKACGNSICVNQLRWLGVRINMVMEVLNSFQKGCVTNRSTPQEGKR